MILCYHYNFLIFLSIILLYGLNCELRNEINEKLCPNQLEMDELRAEFTFIVHLIEKSYVNRENGWRKFAKFLTFLAPKKRNETVNAFCAKNSEENDKLSSWGHQGEKSKHLSANGVDIEQCLYKIFWHSNAELAKLKNWNLFTKNNEVVKMLEGMLMRREQLMAHLLHKALTKNGKVNGSVDQNFDVLAEIIIGRPKQELFLVIMEYNQSKFNAQNVGELRSSTLLNDIRKKIDTKKQQKYDYELLAERIEFMQQKKGFTTIDEQKLVDDIFEKCADWKRQLCCAENGGDCTRCEMPSNAAHKQHFLWENDQIVIQMAKMNNLMRELLIFFDYNSKLANYFATDFKLNCMELIKYMHQAPNSQALSPQNNSWFKSFFQKKKQTPAQKAAELIAQKKKVSRNNFVKIWKLFEIGGLLEPGSEYAYLARTLYEANLNKNVEVVSRIIDIHVGTDMLKVLTNLTQLQNNGPPTSRSTTNFNGMFQVAYMEILKDTQDKCYQFVEPKNVHNFMQNKMMAQTTTKSGTKKIEKPNSTTIVKIEKGIFQQKKLDNSSKNQTSINKQRRQNEIVPSADDDDDDDSSGAESEDTFYSADDHFDAHNDDDEKGKKTVAAPSFFERMKQKLFTFKSTKKAAAATNENNNNNNSIKNNYYKNNKNSETTAESQSPPPQPLPAAVKTTVESENQQQQQQQKQKKKQPPFSQSHQHNIKNLDGNHDDKNKNNNNDYFYKNTEIMEESPSPPPRVAAAAIADVTEIENNSSKNNFNNNNNNNKNSSIGISSSSSEQFGPQPSPIENGINYLKLFNEFTSLFLGNIIEEKMEDDWTHLKVSMKSADFLIAFLAEQVEKKIMKPKWKIVVGRHKDEKQCKALDNEQFGNLLERKHYVNRLILIVQNKWKDIMPRINLNFFKVLLLFGVNLADHRLDEMGETDKREKKEKQKIMKMKTMLLNAINCFPGMELDLNDNFDVHVIFTYVMSRIHFITVEDKEKIEKIIHIIQIEVRRNDEQLQQQPAPAEQKHSVERT